MITNKKFIYAWPILAVFGIFLLPCLYGLLVSWDIRGLSIDFISNLIETYIEIPTSLRGGIPYSLFALMLLLWSFVRWFKNPCIQTLLLSMFIAWVPCGFPGICFIILINFYGFGHR